MDGDVDLQHINTNLQTTAIFTKALGAETLRQFMSDLGLSTSELPSLRGSEAEPKAKWADIIKLDQNEAKRANEPNQPEAKAD